VHLDQGPTNFGGHLLSTGTCLQYGSLACLRVALAIAAAALATVIPTSVVHACSCFRQTNAQAFRMADVVFVATPVARSGPSASSSGSADSGPGSVTWTLAVESVVKGGIDNPQRVTSAPNDGACGVQFELGRRYHVFAMRNNSTLATGLCGGTHQLTGAPAIGPVLAALIIAGWNNDQLTFLGALGLVLVIFAGAGVSRRRLLVSGKS
jgi:hypothetical protein